MLRYKYLFFEKTPMLLSNSKMIFLKNKDKNILIIQFMFIYHQFSAFWIINLNHIFHRIIDYKNDETGLQISLIFLKKFQHEI